jgi:hypothetical protein
MVGEALATAGLELRFVTSHEALVRSFERSTEKWAKTKEPQKGSDYHAGRGEAGHAKRPDRVRHFFKFVGTPSSSVPRLDPKLVACGYENGRNVCDDPDERGEACYQYTARYELPPPWR